MKKDFSQWTIKRKAIIAGILIFLCVSYIAVCIQSSFQVTNVIETVQYIIKNGYPFGYATLILLVIGFVALYYKVFAEKSGVGKDDLGRNFWRKLHQQPYGNAHFETPAEYADFASIQSVEDAYGTILGAVDQSKGNKVVNSRMDNYRSNKNIMVVGASGAGKSSTFTVCYSFQAVKRRESLIINDPDGGLYRDMAGYFKDHGYVVRRLDLDNPKKSDGWDCLQSVSGPNLLRNANLFAHTAVSNFPQKPSGVYFDGPKSLLQACILRVMLGPDYPPEEKNIKSVYGLFQNEAGFDHIQSMFEDTPTDAPESVRSLWMAPYLTFVQSSPNLRGNLVTNLATGLSLLQQPDYQELLSRNEIDLDLPAKQPCAYFCVFPDDNNSNQFLVSLFFSMLFIRLNDVAKYSPRGICPCPVNFLLDEFAAVGTIPDFDVKIATVRKRGIQCVLIFQNLAQIQKNYEDGWKTLMGNCATFVSLGINDPDTATLVQKRIGETTVEVETEKRKPYESPFLKRETSAGGGKRSLLSYEELYELHQDRSVIIVQGHNPILLWKFHYSRHPEAKKMRAINLNDIPDIDDAERREQVKKADEEQLAAYLKKHPLSEIKRNYDGLCEMEDVATQTVSRIGVWLAKLFGLQEIENKSTENEHFEILPEEIDPDDWSSITGIKEMNSTDSLPVAEISEENVIELPDEPVVDDTTGEVLFMPDNCRSEIELIQSQQLPLTQVPSFDDTDLLSAPIDAEEYECTSIADEPDFDAFHVEDDASVPSFTDNDTKQESVESLSFSNQGKAEDSEPRQKNKSDSPVKIQQQHNTVSTSAGHTTEKKITPPHRKVPDQYPKVKNIGVEKATEVWMKKLNTQTTVHKEPPEPPKKSLS